MISKKVHELLNNQINKEFYSAYLYLSFANYYTEVGLNGFANWYNIQAQEERDHALMFLDYMHENDLKVTLEQIDKPDADFKDNIEPLKQGLEHERYVTDLIHKIYAAAQEDKDFRTMQFLDWFVKEQGEEEASADELLTNMKLFGGDPKGLYALNAEYKARVYTAPVV